MTIKSLANIIQSDEAGFACSKSKLVSDGVWHLRPFNIGDNGNLDLTTIYQVPPNEAPKGKTKLEAGDILFNNTNSAELVGKSALVTAPMDAGFSNHLTRIRVDRDQVEPEWFSYWIRRLRITGFFTANATQWVSQAAYKVSEMKRLEIDVPPRPGQRRIIDLLSRVDSLIHLHGEAQKKSVDTLNVLLARQFPGT